MIRFDSAALRAVSIPAAAAEALLGVSGTAVKVYLFGLLRGGADLDELMGALDLAKGDVLLAIEELERIGLLCGSEGSTLRYLPPAPPANAEELSSPVYEDAEFNSALQALFSDRQLSYEDYKMFHECINIYGLPRPVVLMLAEYAITTSRAKNRVSRATVLGIAKQWAAEGVDSIALAQQRLESGGDNIGACRQILKALGLHRLPSEEEVRLYEKWTRQWGFSFGAVKAALCATTAARNPSFGYLDGILANLRQSGLLTADKVRAHFDETGRTDAAVKELLRILGARSLAVSESARTRYLRWKDMGFSEDALRFACAYAAARGAASLEYVDKVLIGWSTKKLLTEADIRAYLQEREQKQARVTAMLRAAGETRPSSRADETAYDRFTRTYGFTDELVLFAARCAQGAASPLPYMDKILKNWRDAGVTTLAAAQAQRGQYEAAKAAPGRTEKQSRLIEREYTAEELSALVHDPIAEILKEESDGHSH